MKHDEGRQWKEVFRGLGPGNSTVNNPVGIHWSSDYRVASTRFANRTVPPRGGVDTAIVLHGHVPPSSVVNPKSKEGKDLVSRFNIWPGSSEKEETVRPGSTVLVTGQTRLKSRTDKGGHIEWKKSRFRTYNPPREMQA
jgi:hypothetical protein